MAESEDEQLAAYRLRPTGTRPVPFEELAPPFERWTASAPDVPAEIARLTGFYGAEPWGRWTQGKVSRIELGRALPTHFVLELRTRFALAPNVGRTAVVSVGGIERSFAIRNEPTTVAFSFELEKPARVIEIRVPNPVSPRELGMGEDRRSLGVGIESIAVRR